MKVAYEGAKATRDALERAAAETGKALRAFPKNAVGLTLDPIKSSPEYQAAKAAHDHAFARLRDFNATFTKQYAREIRAERAARKPNQP